MTEATTDLADAGVADEEELEEVVVLAGVHGGRWACLRAKSSGSGWGAGRGEVNTRVKES